MNNLSELLDTRAVELNLRSSGKNGVLKELSELLVRSGKIGDPAGVYERISAREKLGSTGIGEHIAIPHCATEEISRPALAFGRHGRGVPFGAMDGKPVTLFFLLVVPEGKQILHLQLLSRLARLLHGERLRTALLSAETPADVVDALRDLESV